MLSPVGFSRSHRIISRHRMRFAAVSLTTWRPLKRCRSSVEPERYGVLKKVLPVDPKKFNITSMSLRLFGPFWDHDVYIYMYIYIYISFCILYQIIWYMWVVGIPTYPNKKSICPLQSQVMTSIMIALTNPVWVTTQFPPSMNVNPYFFSRSVVEVTHVINESGRGYWLAVDMFI